MTAAIVEFPARATNRIFRLAETAAPANDDASSPVTWRESDPETPEERTSRHLRDALLTVLTLGLYRCWVRTRLRQKLWSSVRIDGVPLAYTGTARELLVPALMTLGFIIGLIAILIIAKMLAMPRPRLPPTAWRLSVGIPLIYLLGLAAWRHRAFLLERTRLGRCHGELLGNRHIFARTHLLTMLAMAPTLGWLMPWRQVMMQRQLISGMRIGDHVFTFEGSGRDLLRRYAAAWALFIAVYLGSVLTLAFTMGAKIVAANQAGTLPVLDQREMTIVAFLAVAAGLAIALICAWYRIGVWRQLAAMTRIDGRPLRLEASDSAYLRLVIENTAIRACTLMLASPVADERHARFIFSRLRQA